MEIQYLKIDSTNEPNENIDIYIREFSKAATIIDVQCNAIPGQYEMDEDRMWLDDDTGIQVIAFIKYMDDKEASPAKKEWLKSFFDKFLDKETRLYISEPFYGWVTKGEEMDADVLRNCLFNQRCRAYTNKQIASIYKEWLQNH